MRVSAAQRIVLANRAEVELQRFAQPDPETGLRPHALWHRHVHDVTLDAMQILKMSQMDAHPNTIDVSCRRTGKTFCKEIYHLEHLATTPRQELGVVAPRLQQSQTNLSYHLEAIRRSPMLSAYIDHKAGRPQFSDTKYGLVNGSKALAYGIMSQIDGDSLTIASLEETDDMPGDRLFSRFLPMLGAARRPGVDNAALFKPQIRITGVFKGADVLQAMLDSGQYHLLPAVDVYLGIELGVLNEAFMLQMREQLPPHEYIRQFLCKNVSARNHIWELHVRRAMAVGISAGLERADPLPGHRYKPRGLIAFGYDHTGHGEAPEASRSCLVVAEQVGNYVCFPFVRYWGAGVDDKVIEQDLAGYWEYFRPNYAIGDAYGVGMLTSLNDRLYARGLTHIDRRTIGDGQSTASTWIEWPFAPLRFEGMTKHSMAMALRAAFHNGQAAIPPFEERTANAARGSTIVSMPPPLAELVGEPSDFATFVRQLANIKALPTKSSYASYKMANPKLGDDGFDAAMAAVWGLLTRGLADSPTVITSRKQSRDQLLGRPVLAA